MHSIITGPFLLRHRKICLALHMEYMEVPTTGMITVKTFITDFFPMMKKKDLIAKSGISQSSVTKLGHNESVSTDIIVKICTALECDLTDIMELVPEEK